MPQRVSRGFSEQKQSNCEGEHPVDVEMATPDCSPGHRNSSTGLRFQHLP